MTTAIDQLHELLTPAIESLGLGLSLWGIEYTSGPASALLRVYIDAGERPVAIEDCAAVSREISALLDVEDPIPGNYTLEVSSPGVDRPLFTSEQFARYIGEPVKITLALPIDGRRRLQGQIARVEGDEVVVDVGGAEVKAPLDNIQKAKLVPQFDTPAKGPRRPRPARRNPNNPGTA